MRILFICIFLGLLIWFIQQGPAPVADPAAYVGFLIVLSVFLARIARALRLPSPVGALAAGFLASNTGLLSGTALTAVGPYAAFAGIWVSLFLGASLTPGQITSRRQRILAVAMAVGAVVSTTSAMLALHLSPIFALNLGLMAGLAAPFWLHMALPEAHESLRFSLVVTALSMGLWIVLQALSGSLFAVEVNRQIIVGLVCWGAGIEVAVRAFQRVRTHPGRCLVFSVVAFLILVGAQTYTVSPIFLALVTGLGISVRTGRNRSFLPLQGTLSKFLAPFVLANFAAHLVPLHQIDLPPADWHFLIILALAMAGGKILGGLIGSRLTGHPFHYWLPLMPQGLLAATLMSNSLSILSPSFDRPADLIAGFVLIAGLAIPVLLSPLQILLGKTENGLHRGIIRSG